MENRCLTPEEHDTLFRLRTTLQSWGVAADEIDTEELLRGIQTGPGSYRTLSICDDFVAVMSFRYVTVHYKDKLICDAWYAGDLWEKYGSSPSVYHPELMPLVWRQAHPDRLTR